MREDAGADGGARPIGGNPMDPHVPHSGLQPSSDLIQQWLVRRLSEELGLDPSRIDVDQPFTRFGMSSVLAVSLSGELETLVGRRLSPTLVLDYPTIQAVADHLAADAGAVPPSVVRSPETSDEPIAVVGLGCRFPQGADVESFLRLLGQGVDAVTEVPSDRWDADRYYSPDPDAPGKMVSKWGAFLDDVDQFDADFFGISRREAVRMDPQQRLVLEVVWESLENAGIPPSSLGGTRSGVFMGVSTNDYLRLQILAEQGASSDAYSGTGTASSVLSGRVSYLLGLQGPAVTVDSACSSSLLAVHLACRSLREKECDLALAGGVNLILCPDGSIYFSKMRALSPSGKCKAFDAGADGYVRGEGCGVVVLKRLSDARKSGDSILALIRGSAVNHDGRSSGLTVPNGPSQQRVLVEALAHARVSPLDVDYVEAHGTGTPLGDPIEINALAAVYGRDRSTERPLRVGSVKTQIGHLEAAAGVAGLIKLILSLRNELIPRSLHFETPNPYIPWDQIPVSVARGSQPWPHTNRPRLGAVSAFGFSGTNVHIIVEESPERTPPFSVRPTDDPQLLLVSGRNETALRAQARNLLTAVEKGPEFSLGDLSRTLILNRDAHDHRLSWVASSHTEAARLLRGYLEGVAHEPWIAVGKKPANRRPRTAFVFSGQGSQWIGMARGLLKKRSAFRDALDRCEEILSEWADWSLVEEIEKQEPISRLHHTEFAQPIVCAVQIALVAQWKAWGVLPDAVIGHSMGELAAAVAAGALSDVQALRMAFFRGKLMQRASGLGRMAAVDLSRSAVDPLQMDVEHPVSVAAENSPSSVVVSGSPQSVAQWVEKWTAEGVGCAWLPVDCPFHSPLMEPYRAELESMFQKFEPRPPQIPFYSTVLGRRLRPTDSLGAEYWGYNMRNTVEFARAFRELAAEGIDLFVEVGVHPVLGRPIRQNLKSMGREGVVTASLRRGVDERASLLAALGLLHGCGVSICWDQVVDKNSRFTSLPTYPWQRERYWIDAEPVWDAEPSFHTAQSDPLPPSTADAFYTVQWEPSEPVPQTRERNGRTVSFDPAGVGSDLTHVFVDGGMQTYAEKELARLLKLKREVDRVIYLVEPGPAGEAAARTIHDHAVAACNRVVRIVRLIQKRPQPIPLFVVTRGALDVNGASSPTEAPHAPLVGLLKSLAAEHPEICGGLIDLDPEAPLETQADLFQKFVETSQGEKEAALRDGQAWVPRLVRAHSPASSRRPSFRTDGAYLITGGLGGLGLAVAGWMAEHGARRLILMSRSQLPLRRDWAGLAPDTPEGRRTTAIREIEAVGTTVDLVRCDVANSRDLRKFFDAYRAESRPPIRGVIHAAGVVIPGLVSEISQADLQSAFQAKVAGAWNLHTEFPGGDLDLFVLFSSISTLLESPGLGAYAAANAFLDGLAARRRAAGLAGLSINWGFWGETGMGARYASESGKLLSPQGVQPISTRAGLEAFGRLLAGSDSRFAYLPIDWNVWKKAYPSASTHPFFAKVVSEGSAPAVVRLSAGELRVRAAELEGADRSNFVRQATAGEIARILGKNTEDLDVDLPLVRLGFDSLMALELRNWIAHAFSVNVPMSRFFEEPSTADVVGDLLSEIASTAQPQAVPATIDAAGAQALLDDLDGLSDDEVDRLLAELSDQEGDQP